MDLTMELLTMICVALAASAVTYAVLLRRAVATAAEPAPAAQEAPEPTPEPETPDEPEIPRDAVPFDPERPPKTVIYNPVFEGPPRPDLHCTCHDRDLERGTEYLWWTMPDGSVRIYCKDRT